MSFVVDSQDWSFDGKSRAAVSLLIDNFLTLVGACIKANDMILKGDTLDRKDAYRNQTLWECLAPNGEVGLHPEIYQELTAVLGRVKDYSEFPEDQWPPGMPEEASLAATAPLGLDAAWVHHNLRAGTAMACIGLTRAGKFPTKSQSGVADVAWVNNPILRLQFWRDAIAIDGDSESSLERFSQKAYPSLHFADGIWRDLSRFDGGYNRVRNQLKYSLEVLSDFGPWILTSRSSALRLIDDNGEVDFESPTNLVIENRFKAYGLEASPENHRVNTTKGLRSEREVTIHGRTIYCAWHIKLEPHINRVHFHSPIPETNGCVVIGIFHAHLSL